MISENNSFSLHSKFPNLQIPIQIHRNMPVEHEAVFGENLLELDFY